MTADPETITHGLQDLACAALTYRPVDHASLTEPTTPGAAPLYLHRQAVVNRSRAGHQQSLRWRYPVQIDDHGPAHPLRCAGQGLDGLHRTLGRITNPVTTRQVYPGQIGDGVQLCRPGCSIPARRPQSAKQFGQHIFRVAQNNRIQSRCQGFRVCGTGSAGQNHRMGCAPFIGPPGDTPHLQHDQDIRVVEFMLQRKPHSVKVRHGRVAFQAEQRQPGFSQSLLHVQSGREDPFGSQIGLGVDQGVQHLRPQVTHADLIQIGIGQKQSGLQLSRILANRSHLTAGVLPGTAYSPQDVIVVVVFHAGPTYHSPHESQKSLAKQREPRQHGGAQTLEREKGGYCSICHQDNKRPVAFFSGIKNSR